MGGSPVQSSSHNLHNRLKKIVKYEKKSVKNQIEFINELNSWSAIIPNETSKKLLIEFSKCLDIQRELNEELIQKQENLRLQFINVQKREQKSNNLKLKRNRSLSKLRAEESKVGQSQKISLQKEALEELECSMEIVDDQYIRSINTGLKSSFIEYILSFK
ncbi:uncharacterized protein ASCRUDRAFT_31026, partial [Ascoidea rubescens DSM 1968]